MLGLLVLVGVVIVLCVLLNNASFRIGVPVLLAFIVFGMLFGDSGIIPGGITLAERQAVGNVCTVALFFIMFYGGFGTSWPSARPVSVEAGLLATVGVMLTAALTGFFCRIVLRWEWVEALLMGSVVASTDAASVFSILRSRKLNLKKGAGPMLEMESGSNDPVSYMLTIIMISILQGEGTVGHTVWMFFAQLGFGAVFGFVIAEVAVYVMRKVKFATAGFNSLFLTGTAVLSYALPSLCGGNGYLSAYIVGIVLGNASFEGKKEMVHFFDGLTGLMQVIIFFMLGLLASPASLKECVFPALAIFFVITLVARPVTVAAILLPFKKYSVRFRMLISFGGLRGAASIVFAIIATTGTVTLENDIFNIVFCIVLISIALQGGLLPVVSKGLDMLDNGEDIMKSFTDFSDDVKLQFAEINIDDNSTWNGRAVRDINLPKDFLFCMLRRSDGSRLVPAGYTVLRAGDRVTICTKQFECDEKINIRLYTINDKSKWNGVKLMDIPDHKGQVLLIQRGKETVIPNGSTVLTSGDVLYINKIAEEG